MSEYDAVDEGPICAFKAYHRRAPKRPGQWTWRARYRRSIRGLRAWHAANNRASIRAETAAAKGPRGPIKHPLNQEPRP